MASTVISPGVLPGALRETIVSNQSGLIGSAIGDLDNDGKPDIAALVAQDRQELQVFINNGDETFTRHLIVENTPSFGVWVSIEVADVNADGKADIVLGLGDFPELVPGDWKTAHPAMRGRNGNAASVIYLINTHGGP